MTQENTSGSLTQVFQKMADGNDDAAARIWQEFFPRLIRIASKTFEGTDHVVTAPDDAVQSAFFNFWQQAKRGDYPDLDSTGLMRLLIAITKKKSLKHFERERVAKRGGGSVVRESTLGKGGDGISIDDFAEAMPAQDFDRVIEELLCDFDEQSRLLVLLRLVGNSNEEIATKQDWTVTKVERKFRNIRDQLRKSMDSEEA